MSDIPANDPAPIKGFQEDAPPIAANQAHTADDLLLNIDGYEGPISLLLDLARRQKVDLVHISILQLVRQYMSFIDRAKEMNLELAAEYLVMAAWLAYLKSRLLLPKQEDDEEVSAEEMAEALQFQLRRLEAMQKASEMLMERPQLGDGVYSRGMPEGVHLSKKMRWDVSIYDIFRAYGDIRQRGEEQNYDLPVFKLMSMDNAMERMTKMLGALPRKGLNSVWTTLISFVPEGIKDRLYARSALASSFTAGLELVKQGKMEIKQDGLFKPVYMRSISDEGGQ
ncbi:MAG: segregation/condensation protein A [Micavibrio sp. TMED27]|nr:segregation/condensation protein A [Micavibrio sp.]OUT92247.1 MAG: segregation/condensation protein A [Micavibrio sp. TMED27]|tara:strand:+ start:13916 stop:14761 length:846 start_codon:yes stop_codon:yes gene_type:complete